MCFSPNYDRLSLVNITNSKFQVEATNKVFGENFEVFLKMFLKYYFSCHTCTIDQCSKTGWLFRKVLDKVFDHFISITDKYMNIISKSQNRRKHNFIIKKSPFLAALVYTISPLDLPSTITVHLLKKLCQFSFCTYFRLHLYE